MRGDILQYEESMWQLFDLSREQMPELSDAYYGPVRDAVYGGGAVDAKTKRLLSLAIAIQAGCKDCIISQCAKALDQGATARELFEVCAVAVSMGGTLAWSKTLVVADYLRAKGVIG